MNIGDHIRAALFLAGKSTKYLVNAVVKLINNFERTFGAELEDWHGDITIFENVGEIIEKVFE
ncbi:MAG: hypothetical protein HWN65_24045 [Candidatus Helarchaeota archaeon]|nr:hypothetical protein [Candidatus Helarchaeota archaeon]